MSQFKFTSSDFVTVGKWLVVLCAAVSLSNPAFAQAATGVLGGLTQAETVLDDVKDGIYSIVSVFALVYLLYVGVMAFAERKSWADFGWAIIYISLVGASLVLADWAWNLFTS
jgi:hypothetical protein